MTVGGFSLQAGDFLYARQNGLLPVRGDIYRFSPTGVGDSTTDGTLDRFLNSGEVSITGEVDAIDIVETAVEINGAAISSGSLLLSLATNDGGTGRMP